MMVRLQKPHVWLCEEGQIDEEDRRPDICLEIQRQSAEILAFNRELDDLGGTMSKTSDT